MLTIYSSPPKGETTHYDLCVAGDPSNHVRCAPQGDTTTLRRAASVKPENLKNPKNLQRPKGAEPLRPPSYTISH